MSQVPKKALEPNWKKNAKNENIHSTIWLCVLHKALIKHACLRGRASHVWVPRIWLSEGPPKQASRVQTLSVEVCINHRSWLPVSLAKHMSPKVRGPVSKTRWGEMREDP